MYKVLSKKLLADGIYWMDIEAKRAAKSAKPGQFLIVRLDEFGERIPLTVCDIDREHDSVAIVYQVMGDSTTRMSQLEVGEALHDLVCPLGRPSELMEMTDEELAKTDIFMEWDSSLEYNLWCKLERPRKCGQLKRFLCSFYYFMQGTDGT